MGAHCCIEDREKGLPIQSLYEDYPASLEQTLIQRRTRGKCPDAPERTRQVTEYQSTDSRPNRIPRPISLDLEVEYALGAQTCAPNSLAQTPVLSLMTPDSFPRGTEADTDHTEFTQESTDDDSEEEVHLLRRKKHRSTSITTLNLDKITESMLSPLS